MKAHKLLGELSGFLSDSSLEWCVCGGHAIDLFVGRRTRRHKDIDISLFEDQRSAAVQFMLGIGWRVFEPDNGALFEITHPDEDRRLKSNLWCMVKENKDYKLTGLGGNRFDVKQISLEQTKLDYIELMFDKMEDGDFLYRRNHKIRRQLEFAKTTVGGVPCLSPEIVLLYKSGYVNLLVSGATKATHLTIGDCRHDFAVCQPHLGVEQKQWLEAALEAEYPGGHEWLGDL